MTGSATGHLTLGRVMVMERRQVRVTHPPDRGWPFEGLRDLRRALLCYPNSQRLKAFQQAVNTLIAGPVCASAFAPDRRCTPSLVYSPRQLPDLTVDGVAGA